MTLIPYLVGSCLALSLAALGQWNLCWVTEKAVGMHSLAHR